MRKIEELKGNLPNKLDRMRNIVMGNEFIPTYKRLLEKERPIVKYEESFKSNYAATNTISPEYTMWRTKVGDEYLYPNGWHIHT